MPESPEEAPVVLVVEDDDSLRHLLRALLRHWHPACDVVLAPDGLAALDAIARRTVQLVITDYNMPKMDGVELTARIKAASPTTRILMISVLASPGLEARARAAGADVVLEKPLKLPKLEAVIRSLLA
jgi:CheY-like chemotaxis protein